MRNNFANKDDVQKKKKNTNTFFHSFLHDHFFFHISDAIMLSDNNFLTDIIK